MNESWSQCHNFLSRNGNTEDAKPFQNYPISCNEHIYWSHAGIAPILIQQLPTIPLLISAIQGVNVDMVMTEWFNIFCNVHEGNAVRSNMVYVQYQWVHSYHVLLRIYSARVTALWEAQKHSQKPKSYNYADWVWCSGSFEAIHVAG